VLAVLLTVLVLSVAYIYYLRRRTSDVFLRRSKDSIVNFTFTNDGVRAESDLATSEIKWALFDEILKFKNLWLLIYSRSGYLTLPIDGISEECRAFIESHVGPKKT